MTETWYIAGPMRGLPDFNYPLFAKVAETLRRDPALNVLNPAENFAGDQSLDFADYMRQDLTQLMSADVVMMLPGWQDSEGARLEYQVAKAVAKHVVFHADASPSEPAELTAARIVRNGERQAAYGHPADDFKRTATMWSVTMGREVSLLEVAIAMAQLKLSRLIGTPGHPDSIVDAIGYMICYQRIAEMET
jgi:hypothetical protein